MAAKERFLCWGVDHEDLTARVAAARRTKPSIGTLRADPDADPRASFDQVERVIVQCSTGHANVFSFSR
jgi:hypothetical protein